ncbi:sigma-70 family RNA polymerase sigma factor [Actinomadura barringtoniae]|uniref:Sigma-70 family RNA polymerase sigma factor n=1 Tax=Actinomadura barringtoniae TaxID=1427535 RepID=A0A939P5Q9_9ACTN|nr:sigma-70 family RNA polymerase sigma factor [Actinomadura barringtoniae]MBO2445685.1 sigma-70 family RNA polymerase sigma factor [Actinomadura barringtoniae]
MNDDELIAAVAAGDDVALRELFSRHAPWLAARLGRMLAVDAVEDVLQETFLGVWRGAASYRPQGRSEGAAGGWLWGIARRQAALWARRNRALDLPPAPPPPQANEQDGALTRIELDAAVEALNEPDRLLWRLMYEEDRSVAEVAAAMGIPEGTVKSRASRTRRLLRAALGGQQ